MQQKLQAPDCRWDLVVCDEAHKMSATVFGGEIKYTKRYRLGQLLSTLTRHFLLMTATPHNGKEEDFQLFMALLDGDRFEGRFRDGVHVADVSDLMRRMVKESLLKFDGTPLFPERIAYTVPLQALRRRGPALQGRSPTTCARSSTAPRRSRTTSAPEPSASRSPSCSGGWRPRPRRSTSRCAAAASGWKAGCASWRSPARGHGPRRSRPPGPVLDAEDVEDLEDAPDNEVEAAEEEILDQATAARTIAELKAEIETLEGLESLALAVRAAATDTKWRELAQPARRDLHADGHRQPRSNRTSPYGAGRDPRPVPRRARSSSSSPNTATR